MRHRTPALTLRLMAILALGLGACRLSAYQVLPKGHSYTTGGTSNVGIDEWVYGDMGSTLAGFSVNPAIVVEPNAARYSAGIALSPPVNADGDHRFYGAANFLIKDPTQPPAP